MRNPRATLLNRELADCDGTVLGNVVDTYPFDGGGELELVVLRLRRFGERRMVPVGDLRLVLGRLVAPYTKIQIEDSPNLSAGRHAAEGPDRAKAYWRFEEPVTSPRAFGLWPRAASH